MNLSIKAKMVVMGLGVALGLAILAGINFVSNSSVSSSHELSADRVQQFKLAQDMKFKANELLLAAMDSIIDRREGVVAPERLAVINDNSKFLLDNIKSLKAASDTEEERKIAQELEANFQALVKGIATDLVQLIQNSAIRLGEIEARFVELDDVIDEKGGTVEAKLIALEKSFRKRQKAAEPGRKQLRLARAVSLVQDLELAQTRLILAAMDAIIDRADGKVSEERLRAISDNSTKLRTGIPSLFAFARTDEEMALVDEAEKQLEGLITAIEEDLVQFIDTAAKEEQDILASFEEIDNVLDANADVAIEKLALFATSVQKEMDEAGEDLSSSLTTATTMGAIVFLAVIGGVAVAFALFAKSLLGPIGRTVRFADEVAGGDLEQELDVYSSDEIGDLSNSLRSMVGQLKDMIATSEDKTRLAEEESAKANVAMNEANEAKAKAENARREGLLEAASRLEEVVNALSSASEQLNVQVQEVSEGAHHQSNRAQETATSMEEMNATVLEVARNASSAAENAESVRAKADHGSRIVSEVVAAITDVNEKTEEMKRGMSALGEQAEGIGQIITVITDIADQTNLLALNAAIEAARAGEAGRGFAVVADEVRKLAEKTMSATQEVSQAVTSIQDGTRGNVERMDDAARAVVRSTELSGQAGEALAEIVEFVRETSDQVQSIATAAEQQSASSEEINQAVDDINRVSDETVSGMGNAQEAIANLAEQARQLQALINELRRG